MDLIIFTAFLFLNNLNGRVSTTAACSYQRESMMRTVLSSKGEFRDENLSRTRKSRVCFTQKYTCAKLMLRMHKEKTKHIDFNSIRLRGGQAFPEANEQVAGDVRMADDIQEDSSVDIQGDDPTVQEMLWEAAKIGDEEAIEQLVHDGADVNAHDPTFGGWTAMHYAAQNGRWRVIQALVRFGAKVR
jgi:ankyrin repeat protein